MGFYVMRFMHFRSKQTKEEIYSKLEALEAQENHNMFSIFEYYNFNRIGLHVYLENDRLKGYYEDGSRTRQEELQPTKVWFLGRISEKNNECEFKGIIIYSPLISISFFIALNIAIVAFLRGSQGAILELVFVVFVVSMFSINIIKNMTATYERLKKMFQE